MILWGIGGFRRLAALSIVVLLGLLAGLKVRPHLCAIAGAATAVLVAMIAFQMPALLAVSSSFTARLSVC
jgi:L-lactate permease